jgi:hypothetical protein
VILTVNAVIDGDNARHRSGGYESSGNGGAMLLSGDPFLHQPDVALLLFVSAALGAQGGLQDVMQLNLISNTILHIEHAEAVYFRCNTRIV